jgi:hypothetical protein
MNKLLSLLEQQPKRKRFVELTESGPVLHQSNMDVTSANTISMHEVDEPTYDRLMEILQTGKLDNAKVKSIIKAKK